MNTNKELTKTQQEVYDLWIGQDLSVSEISKRRETNDSITYRHIRNLEKLGYKKYKKYKSTKKVGVVTPSSKSDEKQNSIQVWRYHALEFEVNFSYAYPRYHRIRKLRGNTAIRFGAWRYSMYKRKVMVWLRGSVDIKHADRDTVIRIATNEFNKSLRYIANDVGFEYDKERRASIRLVKHHLAYTNPGEFDAVTKDKMYVQFRDKDNKVILQYDRSKGMNEREYPTDPVDTADVMEPHFEAMSNPVTMTNLELQRVVSSLTTNQQAYAEDIAAHVSAIKELRDMARRVSVMLDRQQDTQHAKRERASVLERLQKLCKSKADVLQYPQLVDGLTVDDKIALSQWLVDTFE